MAVTQYCTAFEPSSSGGYLNKTVNAQAITDINANNELQIMLLYENDFTADSSAMFNPTTTGGFVNTDGGSISMTEATGTSVDPKLAVTYTDGSTENHPAVSGGSFDDAFMRTAPQTSSANILAARNDTDADNLTNTGTIATLGNYKVFFSAYVSRLIFRFATNASKTASSAVLHFNFSADVTSGFARASWQGRSVYACKMSSDVSTSFGVEDWSHLDGWESSGSYAGYDPGGDDEVLYNATFFGANF
tara:strand:- start:26494 stop:27237 length:744 start_codon:yes stop_codon:yes gene_type:complete